MALRSIKHKIHKKAKKAVWRVYERIANRRYDFVQKVSRNLVNSYGTIALVEERYQY